MAEALSFVLAVFPLLISAAEHYAEVALAFRRYRHFTTEAATFASMLGIQRAIFRAANKSLLERVVGREQAADMLDNSQHPGWGDKAAEDSFIAQLGDLHEAVLDSMRLIRYELEALGKVNEKFEALIAGKQEVTSCVFVFKTQYISTPKRLAALLTPASSTSNSLLIAPRMRESTLDNGAVE
jgi:hypothetical protein